MTPDEITSHFTRSDGTYQFARWGRPIAPVVFGVEDATLGVVRGAFQAVTEMVGHTLAETDPELGSNCMVFFFRDWSELADVPNLDMLVPDLAPLLERLTLADANQYRIFRFDEVGAIRAVFVFVRMDAEMAQVPADTLALAQVVQSMLLWSDAAFTDRSPLGRLKDGTVILRPEIADLMRAAYDPVMPAAADDPSHALRIAARFGKGIA